MTSTLLKTSLCLALAALLPLADCQCTAATSSSTAPSSTVTVPASCASNVPASLTMTGFAWFNSTHNLDCVQPNYPSDAQVCWNSTSLCTSGDAGCTCTPFCYTGLPNVAYTPLGYGPQDSISVTIDGLTCARPFPIAYRDYELGEGHFDCGSAANQIGFTGDSNADSGSVGSVYYNAYYAAGVSTCDGQVPRYEGSFPLECTRDAGGNATCETSVLPLTLPFVGWAY